MRLVVFLQKEKYISVIWLIEHKQKRQREQRKKVTKSLLRPDHASTDFFNVRGSTTMTNKKPAKLQSSSKILETDTASLEFSRKFLRFTPQQICSHCNVPSPSPILSHAYFEAVRLL